MGGAGLNSARSTRRRPARYRGGSDAARRERDEARTELEEEQQGEGAGPRGGGAGRRCGDGGRGAQRPAGVGLVARAPRGAEAARDNADALGGA